MSSEIFEVYIRVHQYICMRDFRERYGALWSVMNGMVGY